MTKRQKQAKETKRRLYEAAIALIQAKGFSEINIKDITDLAGVSKGTFYTHFETKDALLENFGYRQMITVFRVEGIIKYRKLRKSWGKIKRKEFEQ